MGTVTIIIQAKTLITKMLSKIGVLLAFFAVAQAHSVEKRETTVSELLRFLPGVGDVSRTIAGISFETIGIIILAFIVLDIIGTLFFVGVASGRQLESSWYESLGMGTITGYARDVYNSIDLVDTAFNYMDIEDEECRLKTVCEMERYAVNHPLAKLAINTVNSNLSGLSKYQDAIEAGMNGYDCTLLYSQCSRTYFGY